MRATLKILFVGCVSSSATLLQSILSLEDNSITLVGVITKRQSTINSDFCDLTDIAVRHDVPCHYFDSRNHDEAREFVLSCQPDIIYCFGWSHLLPYNLVSIAPMGAIGFHPSPLPIGRGRHPIIWALALGLKETASSFFRISERADAGPIISQEFLDISENDDAGTLYDKILEIASHQVKEFTMALANGTATFQAQDEFKATSWRKRGKEDGKIDWRMQARNIHNLVRALAKPYVGAHFESNNKMIILDKTKLYSQIVPRSIEPGRIIAINNNDILVKCADEEAIWLCNVAIADELSEGDYI